MIITLVLHFLIQVSVSNFSSTYVICTYDPTNRDLTRRGRIPKSVKVHEYYLSYSFDQNLITYNATVDIHITITSPTKKIVLHSDRNDVLSVSLIKNHDLAEESGYTEIVDICFLQETQMMILDLNREMTAGENATISIYFRGNVSDALNGIYYSTYITKTNETKKVLATHFEPDFARTAFPCFDEPEFKAVFILKLSFHKTYSALSNSAISKRVLTDETTLTIEFKPSPVMSSYLMAFTIHDFDSISAVTKSGTKVNVWLPSDSIEHGKFAIELAPKVLETYERLFNISYQLEKLDLIGIPGFEAGAMENWGLVTFRMTSLLVNAKFSSTLTKQNVGQTIVHELAHQWFGNLVTMEWWNDIWLNEGFATFMESYVMNLHFPEWRIMDQFPYSVVLPAMSYDQMTVTHPLSLSLESIHNIHLLFDHISYEKGAVILSMLMNTIGEPLFFHCIQIYLKKHSYSNANSYNLWATIKEETKIDYIESMMDAWTHHTGFPLITIKRLDKTGWYNISQERMLMTSDIQKKTSVDDQSYWVVPIEYISKSDSNSRRILLNTKKGSFNLTNSDEWVKINPRFGFFYRSSYDPDTFAQLSKALNENGSIFSSIDRMSMISDIMTMVRLGRFNISSAFDHFQYLRKETDLYVILEFFINLKYIYRLIHDIPGVNTRFEKYVTGFSQPIIDRLGWELKQERHTKLLQTSAIAINIGFNDQPTIEKARNIFKKYIEDKSPIEADLLYVFSCAYIKHSTEQEWDDMLSRYLSINDPVEKGIYLSSLSCSENQSLLQKLLNLSLDVNYIPLQDIKEVIIDVSYSQHGAKLAWNFVRQNWKTIHQLMHDVPNTLSRLLAGTASRLKTVEDFNEVKLFMSLNNIEFLKLSFEEALQNIGNNIFMLKNNLFELQHYLDSH